MTRRDRESNHVGERTGAPVRNMPDEPGNLVRQNRFSADDPVEERQAAGMLTRLNALQDKPVHKLAREPNPHSTTHNTIARLLLRHEVVKRPIKMRKWNVDRNAGNRKRRRHLLRRRVLPFRYHATISSRTERQRSAERLRRCGGALASRAKRAERGDEQRRRRGSA
jgi:hypothetical protein